MDASFLPSLTISYDKSIRPYIDLIDHLRKLGVDEDVALPTIIALGDQSSGKSSILEAISGVQLPRGSGLVTRCPLNMQLKRSPLSSENGWIAEIFHCETLEPVIIKNPDEIGKEIERAQDLLTGGDKSQISEELITLKISSPDVPDLSLIDLPGLVRCATKNQPADVPEQIRRIVLKYAAREETVILCVIPLNQDSATIEAYQIAKQVDDEGCRTLGVLTKPDLVEQDKEKEALAVARNQGTKTLVKGYTTVRCRTQKDINNKMTLNDAIKKEENFFKSHKYFKSLNKNERGIHTLADKLSAELVLHIKKCLPKLKERLLKKMNDVQQQLRSLPAALPEQEVDKRSLFSTLVMEFNQNLKYVLTEGSLFPLNIFEIDSSKLDCGQKGCLDEDVNPFFIWRKIEKQLKVNIESITTSAFDRGVGEFAIQGLIKKIDNQRGRELPYFQNYKIFENCARNHVLKYKECIQQCKSNVSENTDKIFRQIAKTIFGQLPVLLSRVLDEANIVREDCLADAESQLTFILDRERLVYSQDDTFIEQCKICENMVKFELNATTVATAEVFQFGAQSTSVKAANHDNSGKKNAEILQDLLRSFFTVANKRICDEVPGTLRICVQQRFFEKLGKKLLSITHEESAASALIKEDKYVEEKRQEFQKVFDRLHEANCLISKFIN